MRRVLTAALLTAAVLLPACNLTSQARVESIKLMNQGIQQLEKNNLRGAEQAMKDAIKADPSHAEAYLNLGKLYRKQENWVGAEKNFQDAIKALEDDGQDPRGDFWYELGIVQVAQTNAPGTSRADQESKWREAIESFTKAISIDPELYRAHYEIGRLHGQLDEPENADTAFRECIKLNAKYGSCFVELGNMYIDYGFANIGLAVLETGAKVNETDPDMWNGMGRAQLKLNRPKDAVEAYKKAKRLDPNEPAVLFGLGMAYAEIPMRKEAEEALDEFLKKGKNVPEHYRKAAQDELMRMQGAL